MYTKSITRKSHTYPPTLQLFSKYRDSTSYPTGVSQSLIPIHPPCVVPRLHPTLLDRQYPDTTPVYLPTTTSPRFFLKFHNKTFLHNFSSKLENTLGSPDPSNQQIIRFSPHCGVTVIRCCQKMTFGRYQYGRSGTPISSCLGRESQ